MDQHNSPNWRQMFEAKRRERPSGTDPMSGDAQGARDTTHGGAAHGGYDDGFDASRAHANGEMPHPALTPEDITDEAAMALGRDTAEYAPWVLQRGGSRPAMMLHLRRFEPKSGLWIGWGIAYPHLIATEYVGDKMLSLDFGTRQFMLQGHGLDELVTRLQQNSVLMIQEYAPSIWPVRPAGGFVTSIVKVSCGGRQRQTKSSYRFACLTYRNT